MSKSGCMRRRAPWVALGLLAILASPIAGYAADRVVLGEEFTATW